MNKFSFHDQSPQAPATGMIEVMDTNGNITTRESSRIEWDRVIAYRSKEEPVTGLPLLAAGANGRLEKLFSATYFSFDGREKSVWFYAKDHSEAQDELDYINDTVTLEGSVQMEIDL